MNVSLAVGALMFALKNIAYRITGSAAILSDAAACTAAPRSRYHDKFHILGEKFTA